MNASSPTRLDNRLMEQDQELKHFCKLCNKSFSSGKVLGGHMRCHRTPKPAKSGKKRKNISMASEIDEQAGYRLRENPKKSWKFSAPDGENQENHCKLCGKGFDSAKALFGHMRHHSGRRKGAIRCKECDKEFESLKSFTSHMKIDSESGMNTCQKLILEGQSESETRGLVRGKRSSRARCKSISNPSSDLNECSSFDGIEPEVEELAICLLMLSRGFGSFNGSESVKLEEPNLKLSSCVSPLLDKKTELVFFTDGFGEFSHVESEMPKLDDESEMIMTCCDAESQTETKNAIKGLNQASAEEANLKSGKLKPRKKQKLESSDPQNENSSCDSETLFENLKKSTETDEDFDLNVNGEDGESKGHHQCAVCFKVFASGQALGGHKRAHVNKAENSAKLHQENSDAFDENCSMRAEEEEEDDGFKSWWDGNDLNDLKQGQLMDLLVSN